MVIAYYDIDIISQPVPPPRTDSTSIDSVAIDQLIDNSSVVIDPMEYDGGRAEPGQGGTLWNCCGHRIWFADQASHDG